MHICMWLGTLYEGRHPVAKKVISALFEISMAGVYIGGSVASK